MSHTLKKKKQGTKSIIVTQTVDIHQNRDYL